GSRRRSGLLVRIGGGACLRGRLARGLARTAPGAPARVGRGEQRPRLLLKTAVGALPRVATRNAEREPAHERRERVALPRRLRERALGVAMLVGEDQLDAAVLAHADARLRRLDPAATDAAPGGKRICHCEIDLAR